MNLKIEMTLENHQNKNTNMEYKLIIAQNTPGKHGADWVELRDEIEAKISRVFAAIDSFQRFKMSAEHWKLMLIGGLTSTFEKAGEHTTLTLTQAVLIPTGLVKYLQEQEQKDAVANACFGF